MWHFRKLNDLYFTSCTIKRHQMPGWSDENWRHNNVSKIQKTGGRPVAGSVPRFPPYFQIETILANNQPY